MALGSGVRRAAGTAILPVLAGTSAAHLLNDLMQSLLIASFPVFRGGFDLSFAQLGLLSLAYQATACLLQPFVGAFTDRRPQPWALAGGMTSTCLGLLGLAWAEGYAGLLLASVMLGLGSSIFHPEAARIARLSSGGRYGLAQSFFQVGGNVGSALGPLLVALVVLPHGQGALAWFAPVAAVAVVLLLAIGNWSRRLPGRGPGRGAGDARRARDAAQEASRGPLAPRLRRPFAVLFLLIFAKYFYLAGFSSYFVFYLDARFGMAPAQGQIALFVFLAAVAAGTLLGGRLTDSWGTKGVIGFSFWGALPFSLALPYLGPLGTVACAALAGGIIASAFSAIVVHAQTLLPHRIGMVSGLFFGLAFGMGGLGSALLGTMADGFGVEAVYRVCAFLPLLGFLVLALDANPKEARGGMPDEASPAEDEAVPETAPGRAQ
jgi:FSR family fosmidomycin resistance protein-like MFS transporter